MKIKLVSCIKLRVRNMRKELTFREVLMTITTRI